MIYVYQYKVMNLYNMCGDIIWKNRLNQNRELLTMGKYLQQSVKSTQCSTW